MQHLRAARLAKRLKREAKEEEEYLPKELIARVDVSEEQEQLAENASDSDLDSDSDSDDEEDCEVTDSEEQEPVQANTPALEILIASSQKNGAFDRAFAYQRGPKPTKRTLFNRVFKSHRRVVDKSIW